MNHYNIRIDGELSSKTFTYNELEEMGVFRLDANSLVGFEVKNTQEVYFVPINSYNFPERQSNTQSYSVDEFGQIHMANRRVNVPRQEIYTGPTPSSIDSSSSSDAWATTLKVLGTIAILAIVIAILVNLGSSIWTAGVMAAGVYLLKMIWNND